MCPALMALEHSSQSWPPWGSPPGVSHCLSSVLHTMVDGHRLVPCEQRGWRRLRREDEPRDWRLLGTEKWEAEAS